MTRRVKLTVAEAATLAGVTPATWRSYVARGQRPEPDGYAEPCGCPWWYVATITRDIAEREAAVARRKQAKADRDAALAERRERRAARRAKRQPATA